MDKKYAKEDNSSMPRIEPTAIFNPDAYACEVVGLASALRHHDSGAHCHDRAQLLYASQGCIRVTLDNQWCMLPPGRAVWIPSRTVHRAELTNVVEYRSIYFRADIAQAMPADVRVLNLSALLFEVLEIMTFSDFEQPWASGRHAHLLALAVDEISQAPCEPTLLPVPSDWRLKAFIANLEQVPPALGVLEKGVGASGKTITRIFQKEVGMSYQQWRQQWRLLRAIELLASGHSIAHACAQLHFSSDSVFIAFFKKMTGQTPKAYLHNKSRPLR